jgi:hypothetical protein
VPGPASLQVWLSQAALQKRRPLAVSGLLALTVLGVTGVSPNT